MSVLFENINHLTTREQRIIAEMVAHLLQSRKHPLAGTASLADQTPNYSNKVTEEYPRHTNYYTYDY